VRSDLGTVVDELIVRLPYQGSVYGMKMIKLLILKVIIVMLICGVCVARKRGRNRNLALERSSRGLVPQLLANYTAPSLPPAHEVGCNHATMACAYRAGCGLALKQYMQSCSDLVSGVTNICSKDCKFSLIALLSTPEGARLMECSCEDSNCLLQKERVEPCRAEVTWNTSPDTIVSCSVATWICAANPLCSTAMDYYNRNCQKMFMGKKCSKRCKNSLDIMLRQESANKLATCYCEGTEDFECINIRRNTDVLCFGKKEVVEIIENTVEIKTSGAAKDRSQVLVIFSFLATCLLTDLGAAMNMVIHSVVNL